LSKQGVALTQEFRKPRRRKFEVTCKICGKTFYSKVSNAVYCSDECRAKAYKHVCVVCNKEFRSPYNNAKYCSDACKNKIMISKQCVVCSKTFLVSINERSRTVCSDECSEMRHVCKCVVCGKEFRSKLSTSKYCSDKCKHSLVTKRCSNCNEEYEVEFYKQNFSKYCSDVCKKIAASKRVGNYTNSKKVIEEQAIKDLEEKVAAKVAILINKLHQTGEGFNGKTIDYYDVDGFSESLKEAVKKRDNYHCYVCGNDNNLEVHHMIPRRNGGSHTMDNLITLCCRCHRHIETGDLHHATRKCIQNAKRHHHIPIEKAKKEMSKEMKIIELTHCIEIIFDKLKQINSPEVTELLIDIDNILDDIAS
jgi:HNH endonuclease